MTPADLKRHAIYLFGQERWCSEAALRLGIDRTTFSRYANARKPIPGPVAAAIDCWVAARRAKEAAA